MSARNKPQYKKAVHWIACNDEPTESDEKIIAQQISVALVADLFGIHECDVAKDVFNFRRDYCDA